LVAIQYCVTEHVHIVGFDMFGNDGLVNNIYKGTESYAEANKPAVDYSYWMYQNRKIFESFPKQNFNFYVGEQFETPQNWKDLPNLRILPISKIKDSIII